MEQRRLVAKWLGNDIWVNITQSVFRPPIPYYLGSLKNGLQDFRLPIQRTIQQPETIIQHKEPP